MAGIAVLAISPISFPSIFMYMYLLCIPNSQKLPYCYMALRALPLSSGHPLATCAVLVEKGH